MVLRHLGGLKKSLGEVTLQVRSQSVSNSLTGGEWRLLSFNINIS